MRLGAPAPRPARTVAPALHRHPHQEETFRVLQGALRTTIGGEERSFGPGETFVVAPGTPHTMHADADEPTRFLWEVRPALRTEDTDPLLPPPHRRVFTPVQAGALSTKARWNRVRASATSRLIRSNTLRPASPSASRASSL